MAGIPEDARVNWGSFRHKGGAEIASLCSLAILVSNAE